MEEDKSGRLGDARTGGDALNRVTPAQGGFASEEQRAVLDGGRDAAFLVARGDDHRQESEWGIFNRR